MSKRTKALQIPPEVKRAVWERDGQCSVLSGVWVPVCCACCHFVGKAQGGLGIEQNIVTLTPEEHRKYDQTDERKAIRETLMAYLMRRYAEWDERKLYYSKGELYAKNPPDRKSNP